MEMSDSFNLSVARSQIYHYPASAAEDLARLRDATRWRRCGDGELPEPGQRVRLIRWDQTTLEQHACYDAGRWDSADWHFDMPVHPDDRWQPITLPGEE